MTASLSSVLWDANRDLAETCLRHPFVRGLGDGRLPRERFQFYVAQDAYFLEAFARAYALALGHAPDREGIYSFAELIQGVLNELKLHRGYAERLGVELGNVRPSPAATAYTSFLLDTAQRGDVGRTCAAMTPCMRLYAFLGRALAKEQSAEHDYSEWIRTYADPGFEALAARLESLLDRYARDDQPVRAGYRRAMELELGFFKACAP